MIDFTDPERAQLQDMKKLQLDQYWRKGQIGDSTYLRSLFIMGFVPKDANVELNLLKLEKLARPSNTRAAEAAAALLIHH